MTGERPIGVLGADWAGLAAVDAIQRLLPHEDVVYLADEAWAPYARRPGAAVADRVARMAADLVAQHSCKLVLVASLQASLDGLAAARERAAPVPVVGVDPAAVLARAAAMAGEEGVEVAVGPACVRPAQLRAALRRGHGGASAPAAERAGGPVVALLCAHTAAAPPAGAATVSGLDLAAASACATLRGRGATVRRRRAGRRILVSSRPAG